MERERKVLDLTDLELCAREVHRATVVAAVRPEHCKWLSLLIQPLHTNIAMYGKEPYSLPETACQHFGLCDS